MTSINTGRGTGGAIDVSNSGLTAADMESAYNTTSACTTNSCMSRWTKSGDTLQSWTPGNQKASDIIDFDYGGITYLVGVGAQDASIWIIKLYGSGDVAGYAWSRAVMDYTGSASDTRTLSGFGAA